MPVRVRDGDLCHPAHPTGSMLAWIVQVLTMHRMGAMECTTLLHLAQLRNVNGNARTD